MVEETVVIESRASAEQQTEAERMGWIPPSRYKGDPERFVDADTFIERGQIVIPILKKNAQKLEAELERVRAENAATAAALAAAQKAIEQIEERHTVATQKAVAEAKLQVKKQLAQANADGDHAGVAELTDQLISLNAVEEEAPLVKPTPAEVRKFEPDAVQVAWQKENPWFGTDRRKTALAMGIAQELRDNGAREQGAAFYALISDEMAKMFPPADAPADKVEGGRSGGEESGRAPRGKSFSSMPADARATCDAEAKHFVGPNKRYKNLAEWRNRYAEIYYEGA